MVAKRTLSNVPKANLHFSEEREAFIVWLFSREDFERASRSPPESNAGAGRSDVLEDTGYSWGQIDHVVLVGGSTRMPMGTS